MSDDELPDDLGPELTVDPGLQRPIDEDALARSEDEWRELARQGSSMLAVLTETIDEVLAIMLLTIETSNLLADCDPLVRSFFELYKRRLEL